MGIGGDLMDSLKTAWRCGDCGALNHDTNEWCEICALEENQVTGNIGELAEEIGKRAKPKSVTVEPAENGYILRVHNEDNTMQRVVFETWEGAHRYMLGCFQ